METFEYELCEACEKAMVEAGIEGLTLEEMLKDETEFGFDLALGLMEDGHDVCRKAKEEQLYSTIRIVYDDNENSCSFDEAQIASVYQDKVASYVTLSTEDLLAKDWKLVKIVE